MFAPGFAYTKDYPGAHLGRIGNDVAVNIGVYSDQNAGAYGFFAGAVGTTQLVRDGEVLVETPVVGSLNAQLPAEEATYTVRTTGTKSGPLSTRVDAEWTFRSAHTDGTEPTPIPALAVRVAPDLDDHNATPAGTRFRFPLHVQRNGAEQPGSVNTPTVEISYDDGTTWEKVRVTQDGGRWLAEVNHPKNAQYASLRWTVSDPKGSTAKATVIHAYALKK